MRERRLLNDTAVADQRAIDVRGAHNTRRQEARVGVDGRSSLVETEFGPGVGQVQTRLKKRPDRSDVLPIPLKNICLHLALLDRRRNDVFSEIGEVIVEAFRKEDRKSTRLNS